MKGSSSFRRCAAVAVVLVAGSVALTAGSRWASADAPGDATEHKMPPAPKTTPVFDAIKALSGTWVSEKPLTEGPFAGKTFTNTFRVTAGSTAIIETEFEGSEHEMLNVFTTDGESVRLTHYCMMGNQPVMKAATMENGVIKFEFESGGNIANRDVPHMDSVEFKIEGNRLTETWTMYASGKVTEHVKLVFVRK